MTAPGPHPPQELHPRHNFLCTAVLRVNFSFPGRFHERVSRGMGVATYWHPSSTTQAFVIVICRRKEPAHISRMPNLPGGLRFQKTALGQRDSENLSWVVELIVGCSNALKSVEVQCRESTQKRTRACVTCVEYHHTKPTPGIGPRRIAQVTDTENTMQFPGLCIISRVAPSPNMFQGGLLERKRPIIVVALWLIW